MQVCKEQKVKEITPNHESSIISKGNAESIPKQDFTTSTSTTLTGHCGLPKVDVKFPVFVFVYNETANLKRIVKSMKRYNKKSAKVLLAEAIDQIHMIIFQMNRAAYLKVCTYICMYLSS